MLTYCPNCNTAVHYEYVPPKADPADCPNENCSVVSFDPKAQAKD